MKAEEIRRAVVGRRITAFHARAWRDRGRQLWAPVLTLDNGMRLTFTVREPDEGSEYGVAITAHPGRDA